MNMVGERIRKRRKELQLTQEQIKNETGISSGNLSDIENGNRLPSTPALLSLSKVLKCSTDWILTGTSPTSENTAFSETGDIKHIKFNNLYSLLNDQEKNEILELMEFKIFKRQQLEKSTLSITTENVDEIA